LKVKETLTFVDVLWLRQTFPICKFQTVFNIFRSGEVVVFRVIVSPCPCSFVTYGIVILIIIIIIITVWLTSISVRPPQGGRGHVYSRDPLLNFGASGMFLETVKLCISNLIYWWSMATGPYLARLS